jgi:phage I-like protein
MKRTPALITLLALSHSALATTAASGEVLLLPAGQVRTIDFDKRELSWTVGDAEGQALAQKLNARVKDREIVFDYEHQTQLASENGQPAPASGWMTAFTWKPGVGLFAAVKWTERAKAFIEANEYKYLSPVLASIKGKVTDLISVALTNLPALSGLASVASRMSAHLSNPDEHSQEKNMDLLNALLAKLGLSGDTSQERALEEVVALKAKADSLATKDGEITTLKSHADTANATITKLQAEIGSFRAAEAKREMDELIGTALKDGKLLPAQEAWARTLSVDTLKGFVANAPQISALSGKTQTTSESGNKSALEPHEIAICKAMNVSEESYLKQKQLTETA